MLPEVSNEMVFEKAVNVDIVFRISNLLACLSVTSVAKFINIIF